MKASEFFSFFSALSKFISDSDGKVVSDLGYKTLQDPIKMKKVNKAVKEFKKDPQKQKFSEGIVVEL